MSPNRRRERTAWAIAVACVLLAAMAVFTVLLMLQRRRRRTQMLVALAAEQAERRRKKKKRAGLRSAEIDKYCPELVVVPAGTLSRAASDDEESEGGDDAPSAGSRAGDDKLATRETRDSAVADDVADSTHVSADTPAPIEIAEGCETCVVCLDEMVVDERVRRLPCSHVYHSSCIRIWLRRKNACPCCCKTVVKRRRRKPRVNLDPTLPPSHNQLEEPPGLPELPVEPPPRASSLDLTRSQMPRTCSTPRVLQSSMSMPIVDPEAGSYVIDMGLLRMRSADDDRPRPTLLDNFSRVGSMLDPDDPTSEAMQSEASSRFDENMASELLEQVRQVLRGDNEGEFSDTYVEFNEDEDSGAFEGNLRLNRPFRGHASHITLPGGDAERRRYRD